MNKKIAQQITEHPNLKLIEQLMLSVAALALQQDPIDRLPESKHAEFIEFWKKEESAYRFVESLAEEFTRQMASEVSDSNEVQLFSFITSPACKEFMTMMLSFTQQLPSLLESRINKPKHEDLRNDIGRFLIKAGVTPGG